MIDTLWFWRKMEIHYTYVFRHISQKGPFGLCQIQFAGVSEVFCIKYCFLKFLNLEKQRQKQRWAKLREKQRHLNFLHESLEYKKKISTRKNKTITFWSNHSWKVEESWAHTTVYFVHPGSSITNRLLETNLEK